MTACLQFFPSRRAPKFLPCSPTILPYFQPFLIPWSDILILDFKVVKTSFAISDYLTRIALLKTAICYKNIDLRHFCRESREKHNIRVSTSKLWEYLQLRTSCKLCNPLTQSHIIISERVPAQCPRPRQVNHWNEEVFQVPAKHIEHHQEAEETRWWFWGWN